jgi:hypothetical protein
MAEEPEVVEAEVYDSPMKALEKPMPDAIKALMLQPAPLSAASLMMQDPENVEAALARRQKNLEAMERYAVASTRPQSWIFKKPKDGRWPEDCFASMDSAGAEKTCDLLEISVVPSGPMQLRVEGDNTHTAYIEGWAYRATTGRVAYVFAERNEKEPFVGRGKYAPNKPTAVNDLKSATMCRLYGKAVEALTGLKKLRDTDLRAFGIDPTKCTFGFGFNDGDRQRIASSTAQRNDEPKKDGKKETKPEQVAREKAEKAAADFRDSVQSLWHQMLRVAGNEAGAKVYISKLTGGVLVDWQGITNMAQVERLTELMITSDDWKKWNEAHPVTPNDAEEKEEEPEKSGTAQQNLV